MLQALRHSVPQLDVCLDALAKRLHGSGVRIDGLCAQARGGVRHEASEQAMDPSRSDGRITFTLCPTR